GHHGFGEVMCGGRIDMERLIRREEEFCIVHTCTKWYPVNGRLPAQVEVLSGLATEHDIQPDAVAHIKITTSPRVIEHCGEPESHRHPQTKETADHSAYYTAAVAIVDRELRLSLDQFTPERLQDRLLNQLADRIELVAVPEWGDSLAPAEVEITMNDGTSYTGRVEHAKGHPLNPVSGKDLEEKFRAMASRIMSSDQIANVIEAIYRLDEVDDVHELTKTLVCTGK